MGLMIMGVGLGAGKGDHMSDYCGRCGRSATEHAGPELAGCARALALEPPRYCAACRRRMVVQITPTGWSARCSEHGVLSS
jgi:hypothetical protein